jgi:hypothetical protein
MDDTQRRDLDETRRLCYMALMVKRTGRYELGGTLAHSLIHHIGVDLDPGEVMDRIVRIVNGDGTAADTQWLGDTAGELTVSLGPKSSDPTRGVAGGDYPEVAREREERGGRWRKIPEDPDPTPRTKW